MISDVARVAFFPDSYREIDGVANTSRQFEAFALRRELPFLTVFGGTNNSIHFENAAVRVELRRSRFGFPVDRKHDFDLAFWRHYAAVEAAVRQFRPTVVHITGPSDVGQLGALIAHRLRVPLAASWHTNVHEYAEQRGIALFPFLPRRVREKLGVTLRRSSLRAVLRFYKVAQIFFAPNPELVTLLERGTGKACSLMGRGVDSSLFNPVRRDRTSADFVVGYVGRLTVEKNVRLLADLERGLAQAGIRNLRFCIVGQGAEESWLKANLRRAEFSGVLKGEALARAYANMDVLVFPSRTDTYGNVVLEALSAGVPAVVSDSGGPRFIVKSGETGFVATNLEEYVRFVMMLSEQPSQLQRMRAAARAHALSNSWDQVFDSVYAAYERSLRQYVYEKPVRMRPQPTVAG